MRVCACAEVMLELYIHLIEYVKKCKYKISGKDAGAGSQLRRSCCGWHEKVGDTGGRGGLGGACVERGSMM